MRPRIGPPFWVHPIQQARAMLDDVIFYFKIYTSKSARPLRVKGLGPISAF
jgi:hypothetical protein